MNKCFLFYLLKIKGRALSVFVEVLWWTFVKFGSPMLWKRWQGFVVRWGAYQGYESFNEWFVTLLCNKHCAVTVHFIKIYLYMIIYIIY